MTVPNGGVQKREDFRSSIRKPKMQRIKGEKHSTQILKKNYDYIRRK